MSQIRVLVLKCIENVLKTAFFANSFIKTAFNRCLNTIDVLQAKDMDHDKPFQEFSDFQPAHRGVTEVISRGNMKFEFEIFIEPEVL